MSDRCRGSISLSVFSLLKIIDTTHASAGCMLACTGFALSSVVCTVGAERDTPATAMLQHAGVWSHAGAPAYRGDCIPISSLPDCPVPRLQQPWWGGQPAARDVP